MREKIKTIPEFWKRRSLKFWLATGMLMSLTPIFLSAFTGHHLYREVIIQPLVEVSSKQQHILQPLQALQLSLWDLSESVIDHAIDGDPRHSEEYLVEAADIEASLKKLSLMMGEQGYNTTPLQNAQQDWQRLTVLSSQLLSEGAIEVDATVGKEILEFEATLDHLAYQLEAIHDAIRIRNEITHQQALISLNKSEYIVVVGLVLSIIGAIAGVIIINRSLVNSMDELALGSLKLSKGDREHQIQVQVPRELATVADAFNQMTQQIKEQEHSLEKMAVTDGLTGLYNRRGFDQILAEELSRAASQAEELSLIICDVDHFKQFNDTYGHQAGDEALSTVGRTLMRTLPESNGDKACRFGGEEFVVVLPKTDADAAALKAEQLREAVASSIIPLEAGQTTQITISLGIASYPNHAGTAEDLLKAADAALYQAKEQGRNRVVRAVQ